LASSPTVRSGHLRHLESKTVTTSPVVVAVALGEEDAAEADTGGEWRRAR